jgi:hypothetical protein
MAQSRARALWPEIAQVVLVLQAFLHIRIISSCLGFLFLFLSLWHFFNAVAGRGIRLLAIFRQIGI